MQKKGGIFNIEKLRWLNKEYMRLQKNNTKNLIIEKLKVKFENKKIHPKLVETIFEKIEVISDIDVLIENGELDYFFNKPELEIDKICWKNQSKEDCKQKLEKILVLAKGGTFEDFLRCHLRELAEKEGKGEVLWPLRYVLSGREKSPDPFTLIEILGVEETIKRIQNAIQIL